MKALSTNIIQVLISKIYIPTKEEGNLRYLPKDDPQIIELAENIAGRGLQNIFSVKPANEEQKKAGFLYEIKDGSRRCQALKVAVEKKLISDSISVNLQAAEDDITTLMDRMVSNLTVEKTKTKDYIDGLLRIKEEKGWSNKEIADKMNLSKKHINDLLKTIRLPEDTREALANDKLTLGNALILVSVVGKCDDETYKQFEEKAKTLSLRDFTTEVTEFTTNYKETLKAQKKENQGKFVCRPMMLKKGDIEDLLKKAENDHAAKPTANTAEHLRTLQMIFQVDEVSTARRKAAWEKQQKEIEDARKQRLEAKKTKTLEDQIEALKNAGYQVTK